MFEFDNHSVTIIFPPEKGKKLFNHFKNFMKCTSKIRFTMSDTLIPKFSHHRAQVECNKSAKKVLRLYYIRECLV